MCLIWGIIGFTNRETSKNLKNLRGVDDVILMGVNWDRTMEFDDGVKLRRNTIIVTVRGAL